VYVDLPPAGWIAIGKEHPDEAAAKETAGQIAAYLGVGLEKHSCPETKST